MIFSLFLICAHYIYVPSPSFFPRLHKPVKLATYVPQLSISMQEFCSINHVRMSWINIYLDLCARECCSVYR